MNKAKKLPLFYKLFLFLHFSRKRTILRSFFLHFSLPSLSLLPSLLPPPPLAAAAPAPPPSSPPPASSPRPALPPARGARGRSGIPPHGIRSNGAVSAKHTANTLSTASRAFPSPPRLPNAPPPPPHAGFIATDSAALRRAHACACALRPQFPREASAPNEQSPERAAARTSEHAWWSQSAQSRLLLPFAPFPPPPPPLPAFAPPPPPPPPLPALAPPPPLPPPPPPPPPLPPGELGPPSPRKEPTCLDRAKGRRSRRGSERVFQINLRAQVQPAFATREVRRRGSAVA